MNATLPAGISRVVAEVPTSLHRRAKNLAKKRRKSISELVRVSLEKEIELVEAKAREEEALAAAEKAPKRQPSAVTTLDQRPTVEIPIDAPIDRLAALFEKHARKIMEVSSDPQQVGIRQQEAFAAIRKFAPLSYRDDEKISERLESVIMTKASMETEPEDDVATPNSGPPPIMARSLLSSAPAVTTPAGVSGLGSPEMFALLRQMLTPQGQPVEEDVLAGKMINAAKVRTKSVLDGDEE